MHIHIATVGKTIEPITKALNAIDGIDEIFLLTSTGFETVAENLKVICEGLKIKTHVEPIDAFDFQNIVDTISKIYRENHGKNVSFSINITGGTNLMAAAACSCAFIIGATIYYVHWNDEKSISTQLKKIPVPHAPNLDSIKGKTKEILIYIANKTNDGWILREDINSRFTIDKQNAGYHLNKLESEGLIEIYRDGVPTNKDEDCVKNVDRRKHGIKITPQGKMIACWFEDNP